MTDRLTPEKRSALMSRVRTRDTAPELALRKALWAHGARGWRLHPKGVPGKPDITWTGRHVAVFVDGAFWHGHPDYYWGQSGEFWNAKIKRNRARDRQVDAELKQAGWTVLRFWDFEVEQHPEQCVEQIAVALDQEVK